MSLLEHGLTVTVEYPKFFFDDLTLSEVRLYIDEMELRGWDIKIGNAVAVIWKKDTRHFDDMQEVWKSIKFA